MPNRERAEVLQGTLDIMVLQTLAALGPSHGYAMAARIEQVSGGRVQLNMGTLYPGLMRLEQRGFVRGTWGRKQPQGAVLRTHAGRQEAARRREAEEPHGHHHADDSQRAELMSAAIREWLRRLRATFHKAPEDAEMEEELRLHVDMIADELKRRGLSFEDAARARLQAGGIAQVMEQRAISADCAGSRTSSRTSATVCARSAGRRSSPR